MAVWPIATHLAVEHCKRTTPDLIVNLEPSPGEQDSAKAEFASRTKSARGKGGLSNVRVLEFTTGIAGPMCGRFLAQHGARVVKIESRQKPDTIRLFPPDWIDSSTDPWIASSMGPMWSEFNAGKRSVSLNVKHDEGLNLARCLAASADVFLVNYSAGVAERLGLGYNEVAASNPRVIYVSIPGFGNTGGPYATYRAWGPNLSALAGIDYMTGWADRPPSGVGSVALPDYLNALHAFVAILAALRHREMTSEGQFVDISQFEGTVSSIGAAMLDVNRSGEQFKRLGTRSLTHAPQGVYATVGEDQWVALTVTDDDQWARLAILIGQPQMSDRFGSVAERQHHHDVIDGAISTWSRTVQALSAATALQGIGIAASPVNRMMDLAADPHLITRHFWRLVNHPYFDRELITGHPIGLSESSTNIDSGGPAFGEHTMETLRNDCGLSEPEIEHLIKHGSVESPAPVGPKFERPYLEWARRHMDFLDWPA